MFIGREKELSEMNRRYREGNFQFFILYGRRRVGKTTLLKEFCRDKNHIFYSAEQSNEKLNLDKFSAEIITHYGETFLEPFRSWEKALTYIDERQREESLVLVLDEFPYLAATNPSLLSILQHLIDHRLQRGKLFLILCGSYMGFMENEVLGAKSPLFGRRTAQLYMKPFDYLDSVRFMDGFSQEEKLMLYGAFGGTAMYLRQIRSGKTIKDNIIDAFLRPVSYLYEEPLLLMRQEVQEPGVYCAIIEAIATGATKANEIAVKTGEESAKCLKYISTLRKLGIVYKEVPFGEKETSRRALYHLSDFMFRFWYRYVSSSRTLLETDAQEIVWNRRIEPDYSHYMGQVFERICRDYLLRQNSKGALPILFTEIGRWWGTNPKSHEQVEIDLVAKEGNTYLFCECKWTNEPVDLQVLKKLQDKSAAFGPRLEKSYFMLFSRRGFTERVLDEAKENDEVLLADIGTLFECDG